MSLLTLIVLILLLFYLFKNKQNKIEKSKIKTNNKRNEKSKKTTHTPVKPNQHPNTTWIISISFGESTSKNFERAIFLAKKSTHFSNYTTNEGTKVFQADFNQNNFSNYLDLYQIVSNWKSSFVFVNGQRVGKKEISTINRCYGDKIAFNDKYFCFGASMHTENPFGCHRLMITPSQGDWKTYGFKKGDYWIIDKPAIARKIIEQSKLLENCPAFNLEQSLMAVKKLPDKIKIDNNFILQ